MTGEQLTVLREWATGSHLWLALRVVEEGSVALRGQQGGSTVHGRMVRYDGKGVEQTLPAPVTVTARDIDRWHAALPSSAAGEARRMSHAMSARQRGFPVFAASSGACGCGPGLPDDVEGPLTYARTLYEAEHDAWHEDHYLPWLAESRRLTDEARSFIAGLFDGAECQGALFDLAGVA